MFFELLSHGHHSLSHWISPLGMLLLWGGILGGVSMGVYGWVSNQKQLQKLNKEIKSIHDQLEDESFAREQGGEAARALLRLAVKRVRLTCFPALLSSLPILVMWGFLFHHFDPRLPEEGEEVAFALFPPASAVMVNQKYMEVKEGDEWRLTWPKKEGALQIKDAKGKLIHSVNLEQPAVQLKKMQWWNIFMPSPYGYLQEDSGIQELRLYLPSKEYLLFGPLWMRSWLTPFFAGLLGVSWGLKYLLKIE